LKLNRLTLTLGLAAILVALVAASFAVQRGVSDGGKVLVGGPFQLIDHTGKPADESVLDGEWSAVFFGFTHCPDICPATLQSLAAAASELRPERAADLQVVLISVDPERDTPQAMKAYIDSQDMPVRTLGLTGTPDQVKAAIGAYRAFAEKAPLDGGGYTMNHSTAVYLMDPSGRFDRVLSYGLTPPQMAELIDAAMRGA
jgi:protein SCO1/2